jgi:hypothetical protein
VVVPAFKDLTNTAAPKRGSPDTPSFTIPAIFPDLVCWAFAEPDKCEKLKIKIKM